MDDTSEDNKEEEQISKKHNPEAEALLREAIHKIYLQEKKDYSNKVLNAKALEATIEEFLKCFIIIGYDFEGEPYSVVNAHTQEEADALSTSFNKILLGGKGGFGTAKFDDFQ